MAKETKQGRAVAHFISRGWMEVPSRSRKYRQLRSPGNPDKFAFFGKNGAIRVGRNATESISLTDWLDISLTDWLDISLTDWLDISLTDWLERMLPAK